MLQDNSEEIQGDKTAQFIESSEDTKECLSDTSYEKDLDSDVTKAIKDSIERNSHSNFQDSESSFREVVDLVKNVINEIPIVVSNTGKTINKMIVLSREGIETINNFKNTVTNTYKDESFK